MPCFLGGMSRGMLGKNSPIHIRQRRRDALKEADVVILAGKWHFELNLLCYMLCVCFIHMYVHMLCGYFWKSFVHLWLRSDYMYQSFIIGCVADFRLSYGRVLSRRSKIIAVNRNKEQLYKVLHFMLHNYQQKSYAVEQSVYLQHISIWFLKMFWVYFRWCIWKTIFQTLKISTLFFLQNSDMFWKPTVAVQADVATFVTQLHAALRGFKCDPEWPQSLKQRDIEKESGNE